MTTAELTELQDWLGEQPRHPRQTHGVFESDAEIVRMDADRCLVSSVDAVAEEIGAGLYRDAYTVGWVTAMAALADIAAVGAEPVGVLLSSIWGPTWKLPERRRAAAGFGAALKRSGTALLGGDTGEAASTVLSATAVATGGDPLMARVGARPGDVLCITGSSGAGAALAARHVLGDEPCEQHYRPCARLDEGARLRHLASACTDTSDGVLGAIALLAAASDVGVALEWDPEILDERAVAYFASKQLPLWLMWVSEIGDYELLLAVPEEVWPDARAAVPSLKRIGSVRASREATVAVGDHSVPIDLAALPRLSKEAPEVRAELLPPLLTQIHELGLP